MTRKSYILIFSWLLCLPTFGQDIVWEKRIRLPKEDEIYCMTKDQEGNIYLGGQTMRGAAVISSQVFPRALVIKLNENGDTIYTRLLDDYGSVYSMVEDYFGNVHLNVKRFSFEASYSLAFFHIWMHPLGFVIKRDTINPSGEKPYPYHCILASDSSVLITGNKRENNRNGMFLQRIRPDWSLDTFRIYQPGGASTEGNNIEELPNGRIMISGPFSNRLGSVEVDKDGTGEVAWTWEPNLNGTSYQTAAFASQGVNKGFLGRADGLFRWYDSLRVPYQSVDPFYGVRVVTTHTDGSMVYNETNSGIFSKFIKRNADTTIAWSIDLATLGTGAYQRVFNSVVYNSDQSAIIAGFFSYVDTTYDSDPYIVKIANVGTPVTSLIKPKKGVLQNESLAPWPNPTSGTLYLKQHFNRAEIRMYNLAGKEMGKYHLRFAQPIDVSGYESGVYLYRAVIDGKRYSGKVIKR